MGVAWVNERGASEIKRGVLHVYAQNVERVEAEPGEWVEIRYGNETLAYGFYSPTSSIPLKVFSREEEEPEEVILSRMESLWREKRRLYPDVFRWVFAEGDLLPGLIVDVYNDVSALRVNVLGVERYKQRIAEFIVEKGIPNVVERNESPVRELEGLPKKKGLLAGKDYTTVIDEGGARFFVDVLNGQKTGFYLDQRENRIFAERFGEGRILDVFSYTGGFGIHMGISGAEVHFVEVGREETDVLKRNLELNEVTGRIYRRDAVEVMKGFVRKGKRYDVVVLDPPALAKKREDVDNAKKMYFLLNRLAVRLLRDGGILLTSSCTHYITPRDFLGIVRGAAEKEGKRLRMLGGLRGQASDHTVYLPQPETLYLKHGIFVVEG